MPVLQMAQLHPSAKLTATLSHWPIPLYSMNLHQMKSSTHFMGKLDRYYVYIFS